MTDDDQGPLTFHFGDELDLHSFAPRDVPELVRDWLDDRAAAGSTSLRLVHGKGIGVQRERVRALLARDPRVVRFADAPLGAGSWGATVIDLDPGRLR